MAKSVYLSLLTKDYARKAGMVRQMRRDLREQAKEVLKAEAGLAALATVIRGQDPAFDPLLVKPVQTIPKIAGLRYNKLTTLILECLRLSAPEAASKEMIALFVAEARGLTLDLNREEYLRLSRCVQKRLKGMAAAGTVVRHHDKWGNGYGIWSLPALGATAVHAGTARLPGVPARGDAGGP